MTLTTPPAGTRIWLISGISNARGWGLVEDIPATYNTHSRSVYSMDQWGRWTVARDPLIGKGGEAPALAHPNTGGVGCGIAFANKLIDLRPGRVGLVVSARGGQAMPYFMPSADPGSAYRAIVRRALRAKLRGPLQGMIWYSGEADTADSALVDQWESGFKTTIDQLRADVGVQFPVMLCAIGDHKGKFALEPRHSQWLRLRAIQMNIDHPRVHPVGTRGLPLKDTAHLSTAGQIQLGRNIARVYVQTYFPGNGG